MKLEDPCEITIAWSDADEALVARITELLFAGAHGDEAHEEALANARSAIRSYVEVARELGKPVPEPVGHLV